MYMLGLKYLEALPQMAAGKGTTIFLPAEAAGVMGALGGLKEMVAATGNSRTPDATPSPAHRTQHGGLGVPGVPRALGDGSDDKR